MEHFPTFSRLLIFIRRHVFPVLLVLLIPGFSAWFFHYAEQRSDREILATLELKINADPQATLVDKALWTRFYHLNPVSEIMTSSEPQAVILRKSFETVRVRYAIFRWMRRIAWVCLLTTLATFAVVGASVALSFRSPAAQYWALRLGWPALRTSVLVQTIGQGVLAAALSFWVTAIFFDLYSVKLIFLISLLALIAVAALVAAIFRKVDHRCDVEGHLLDESTAPALWQRVRTLAAQLGTAPPDRIIVGIDANFFVTEHPVAFRNSLLHGRSLYLSLPMLKILRVDEADAVLGHELAHFNGQDTLWSRKISPLLGRFGLYIQALNSGLSFAIAQFMLMFWKLYMLSIRRLSRQREFRADKIGGQLTSPDAMKRALIKVASYCDYRERLVGDLIGRRQAQSGFPLGTLLEQGYPEALHHFLKSGQAATMSTPHPFDSHPPLDQRLRHLGFNLADSLRDTAVLAPLGVTWHQSIPTATQLEETLWAQHEAALQAYHEHTLPWRLRPDGPEEEALVLAHFPPLVFAGTKGAEVRLHYDRIEASIWDHALPFDEIQSLALGDHWFKKRLTITFRPSGASRTSQKHLRPDSYQPAAGQPLLAHLERYFGRHKTAEGCQRTLPAESGPPSKISA